MFSSRIGWLVPVTLTLLGLGTNLQTAKAENTNNYQFSVDYSTLVEIDFSYRPDLEIVRATITGESTSPAPFGLDFFTSNTYGKLQPVENPSIRRYNFNSDPSVFGLSNEPTLFDIYYGSGKNKLFGRANDTAEINFETATISGGGTITIYDGTGIFKNATGTITFTQEDRLDPSGGASRGLATLNFNLQTPQEVPEPAATTTLIGMGVVAAGLRIKKRNNEKLKV